MDTIFLSSIRMRLKKLKLHSKKILRRIKLLRIILNSKKGIATALGVLAFAVLMWGGNPNIVSADFGATAALFGGAVASAVVGVATNAGMIWVILYVLRVILTVVLGVVGGLLDFVFILNTTVNPSQLIIVQEGWTILRDLANGMFILILLWIALTIIFNIENLGGKRLLVRLIIVAFFINFSLVMVSTVFALGNELAKPFQKALGTYPECTTINSVETCTPSKTTISTLVMQNTRIQTALDVIVNQSFLENATNELKKLQQTQGPAQQQVSLFNALAVSAASSAAIGLLSVSSVVTGVISSLGGWYFNIVVNLAIANGILLLTILGLLTATVVLFLRIFAMVLLAVSAPIAFLSIAFPKYGERFWSQWTDQLIRWTFTAPIFYFLLYLSLLMLQTNQSGNEKLFQNLTITSSLFMILNLVLFLIFLWLSVYITKKTAGHFAEVVLGVGRKAIGFGLGVGTGFAAAGAAKLALRGQKSIDKVSSSWIGRGPIGGMLARRTQAYIQQQKKRVAGRASQWEGTSEEFKKSQLAGAVSAETVTAISLAALKDKQPGVIAGKETRERAVRLATRVGSQEEILKAFPGESDVWNVPGTNNKQEAVNKTLGKVDDLSKVTIPVGADPTTTNTLLQGILFNIKSLSQLQRIARENTPVYNSLSDYWDTKWDNDAKDFRELTTTIKDAMIKTGLTGAQAEPIAKKRAQDLNTYFRLVLGNIMRTERQARAAANQNEENETGGEGGGTPAGDTTTPPTP